MAPDTKKKATDDDAGDDIDDKEDHDDHEEHGDAELVNDVVARVLAILNDRGDSEGSDDDDADSGEPDDSARPRTQRDEEQSTFQLVKAAMADLRREEATDARVKKLERRVEQAIVERAPAQLRRLTRAMWGSPKERK